MKPDLWDITFDVCCGILGVAGVVAFVIMAIRLFK